MRHKNIYAGMVETLRTEEGMIASAITPHAFLYLSLCVVMVLVWAGGAAADILVYEGFNYAVTNSETAGVLDGKSGGSGFSGAWVDGTTGTSDGDAFIYDSNGNPVDLYGGTFGEGDPNWDGVVDNLPSSGNWVGQSDWDNGSLNANYQNAYRQLSQSADTMAGTNNTLWASFVVHYKNSNSANRPGFAFSDGGCFEERARNISNVGSRNAIGIGSGNQNLWPSGQVCPVIFSNNVADAENGPTLSLTNDNIVIMKFVFGATDTVYAYSFTETDTLDEATFTNNAVSSSGTIDESTLTHLTVSVQFDENAFDEIRIGDTFDDVVAAVSAGITDADASWMLASPTTVAADGATASTITVLLRDAGGVPVTNHTVSVSGNGTATITPASATSDASGEATFQVTSSTPGTEVLVASNVTDSVGITRTVSVTFQGVADASNSTVTASTDALGADAVSAVTITVTLKDSLGNVVAGKDVTLAGNPGNASISPSGAQTSDANGQVSFDVMSSTVGTEIFTATETNDSVIITQTVSVAFVTPDSSANLLVYEPFNYEPVNDEVTGALYGKDGGVGFSGAWVDGGYILGGEAFIYDSNGNADTNLYDGTYGAGNPDWDGTVDNVPSVGNWIGLSDWSNNGANQQYIDTYRSLAQSADAMAGTDNTLWLSMIVHFPNNGSAIAPGLALTDGGYLYGRSEGLTYSAPATGDAIGIGNGGRRWPVGQVCPLIYESGSGEGQDGPSLSTTKDNIVIVKVVFGTTDRVYAYSFTETDTLDQTTFNSNAVSTSGSVDESTLDTLSFSMAFPQNALDEIRIGNTFLDVVTGTGPPSGTVFRFR